MAEGNIVQIAPLMREKPGMMEIKIPREIRPDSNGAKICGMYMGSNRYWHTLASASGEGIAQPTSGTEPSRRGKSCSSWRLEICLA